MPEQSLAKRVHRKLKRGPREYRITYRGEFGATVEAPSAEEALKKFKRGDCEYELVGGLWDDYLEVERLSDGRTLKESGRPLREEDDEDRR